MAYSLKALVENIHASGREVVISITGGATGAIPEILSIPGGSRTLLAAEVPYSSTALAELLGGEPDQYCSEATARAMAMASWKRARRLSGDSAPSSLVGVGATASLVSRSPKRGDHRVHVAVQTSHQTSSYSLTLEKGARTRLDEEQVASALVVTALAQACDLDDTHSFGPMEALLRGSEQLQRTSITAPTAWSELLVAGTGYVAEGDIDPRAIRGIFPGAFNPLHGGHRRMVELAEQKLAGPVCYELSITNVEKAPLDFIEIDNRLKQIRCEDPRRAILLSAAPTFDVKAELWPGCTFVVGADTIARVADARYYAQDETRRNAAIEKIAERSCKFLVFGRKVADSFQTLGGLRLPAKLCSLCQEVPESEFRDDVSSTALRRLADPE